MIKRIFLLGILIFAYLSSTFNCTKEQKYSSGKSTGSAILAKTESIAQTNKVTFIELGSVDCIPCKMMMPIMKEIEKEYGDRVKVVFYDVWTDEGRPFAEKYGVKAIPTQVFLDSEENEFFRHVGFFPKADIEKVLARKGIE